MRSVQQYATNDCCRKHLLTKEKKNIFRFYATSNWADVYGRKDCNCFNTASWFDKSPPTSLDKLSTASVAELGLYCNGTNRDSYAKAAWEDAYAYALVASLRWLDLFESWAADEAPGIFPDLARASPLRPDETLFGVVQTELLYMFRVAEWSDSPAPLSLGHWKGPNSAAALKSEFIAVELANNENALTFRQRFVDGDADWRDVVAALERSAKPTTAATIAAPTANLTNIVAVIVRTNSVKSLGGGRDRDKADFYGEVEFESDTGHALLSRETVQRDVADLAPPWASIYFADVDVVTNRRVRVTYTLKDEDGLRFVDDALVRIAGTNSSISFTVDLDKKTIDGIENANGVVTTKGMASSAAAAAELKFTVRVVRLDAACTGTQTPCHTPGDQVCQTREMSSRPLLSDASVSAISAATTLIAAVAMCN